jgi:hypothetical protein
MTVEETSDETKSLLEERFIEAVGAADGGSRAGVKSQSSAYCCSENGAVSRSWKNWNQCVSAGRWEVLSREVVWLMVLLRRNRVL